MQILDSCAIGTIAGGQTVPICDGFCPGPGSVFKFNPKTLKFTILHTFDIIRDQIWSPGQSIAISADGATLYGIPNSAMGGDGGIYRINLATGKVTNVHDFAGIVAPDNPVLVTAFSLALHGGKLYGTIGSGGRSHGCDNQGCGTVFQLVP